MNLGLLYPFLVSVKYDSRALKTLKFKSKKKNTPIFVPEKMENGIFQYL